MSKQVERLQESENGAKVSIAVYILMAGLKLGVGLFFNASSLIADGFNNFGDVISSIAMLIGLRTSRIPPDDNHPYGHWKAESIASLLTSFIMILLGMQVLTDAIGKILSGELTAPNPLAGIVGLISAMVMWGVHRYNLNLSHKTHSKGLKAVAKDNLADALTSLATAIAIFAASFSLWWVDYVMALIVGGIILKTGVEIASENMFSLSDGFNQQLLNEYRASVIKINGIQQIVSLKARMYGNNIYVDITIVVSGNMSVQESHDLTEKVEELLFKQFDVMHTDVHVEPASMH
ncbi:cation diffusion facilitator family transporter [Dolosigranulum savutiense]|uniref:Cation diffusion facilitator family transporter n=1 Tax=Dolosigranulum savutiense TaxID=3110288 RepID=A0AB74TPX3_9LACT